MKFVRMNEEEEEKKKKKVGGDAKFKYWYEYRTLLWL